MTAKNVIRIEDCVNFCTKCSCGMLMQLNSDIYKCNFCKSEVPTLRLQFELDKSLLDKHKKHETMVLIGIIILSVVVPLFAFFSFK